MENKYGICADNSTYLCERIWPVFLLFENSDRKCLIFDENSNRQLFY